MPDDYRLVSNGVKYRIQQRSTLFHGWRDVGSGFPWFAHEWNTQEAAGAALLHYRENARYLARKWKPIDV